jgi:hypothetical protein
MNYHTLGRKANFCREEAEWYLEARNLVIELSRLTIDPVIIRDQA